MNDYYDVFLSYRRGYPEMARLIKKELVERGFRVFLDVEDLKQCYFDERLANVIRNSGNFICLITPGSLERCQEPDDWVRREIETAFATNRNIVVVNHDSQLNWAKIQLPPTLIRLPAINAVTFDHNYFTAFVNELAGRLKMSAVEKAQQEFSKIDEVALSSDFHDWQQHVLKDFYGSSLAHNAFIDNFPLIEGKRYPLMIFPAYNSELPFKHRQLGPPTLINRTVRELPNDASYTDLPEWLTDGPSGGDRQHYYELLSLTKRVRRWNMRGFALSGLQINERGEVEAIEAELCTYGENCLTSHFLGYQLLNSFIKGEETANLNYNRPEICWEKASDNPSSTVMRLKSDAPFLPLISVQAIVIYRDPHDDDEWQLVAMAREGNVAAAAGFWQFPPAGGFEIYGREDEEHDYVISQFDLRLAIIREFLEEIYGDVDMACEHADDASGHHSGSVGFQKVMLSIKNQLLNIHLLGVVTDLVSLRSEFSFVIVIEDPELFQMTYTVKPDNESSRKACWLRGSHEGKRLIPFAVADIKRHIKGKTWHSSSIGMLKLLANVANNPTGWFRQKYTDFPKMDF